MIFTSNTISVHKVPRLGSYRTPFPELSNNYLRRDTQSRNFVDYGYIMRWKCKMAAVSLSSSSYRPSTRHLGFPLRVSPDLMEPNCVLHLSFPPRHIHRTAKVFYKTIPQSSSFKIYWRSQWCSITVTDCPNNDYRM
jgi:hypothetical protein